jgi:Asp-tRNA(Asn)/Glu-tRNA(Gln) amidotransferase A subunit family amidase
VDTEPRSREELCFTAAGRLAELIRTRTISPLDIVDASLERIESLNPVLNLFCFVYAQEARDEAKRAERAVARGAELGPLHGVPYALKDLTPTKGKRTTLGSYAFEHWIPHEDPPVAERMRAAGGILIGKTTTPEFAYSGFTSSPLWGVSRNPWDPARTPGGSSGGSAGAVAAGMVPLAEGSDAGGSIRIPASYCGIFGLKPSLGRVPMHISSNDFEQLFHMGPLTRGVSDGALMLSVMQGPDERDPQSLSPPFDVPLPLSSTVEGMHLALSLDLGYAAIHPDVEENTRRAAEVFEELGATVEAVELGWTREVHDSWSGHWRALLAAAYGDLLEVYEDRMDPKLVRIMRAGERMSAVELKRLDHERSRQWDRIRPILQSHDAMLCPTMAIPPPPAEGSEERYGGDTADGKYVAFDLTCPFNLIGQCPAASVPSGFDSDGLPTGLQIVGRRFADLTVLGLAAAYEHVAPWTQYRPPTDYAGDR